MTQKTAMQRHIHTIDSYINYIETNNNGDDKTKANLIKLFNEFKQDATKLLIVERTQIQQAYDNGYSDGTYETGFDTGLDYFTKTYEQI